MNKFVCTILIILGVTADLVSQTSASASAQASASADIVQPINIASTLDVSFGTVAVIVAGQIELVQTDSPRGASSIILPTNEVGTFTAASFFTESTSAYAFTITVPSSPLEIKDGNKTMIVSSFKSDPLLNQETGLIAGVYVAVSPLNVTVNYN